MIKPTLKKVLLPVMLSGAMLISSTLIDNYAYAKGKIKCAIVAPKGSTWMNILEEWDKELKKKTNNNLGFKFYSSGSMGDERTVLRKMRSGQLDAAGFTGVGLGEITPEVRLMELPFMFDNNKEVDYVLDNMNDFYDKKFEEKGFINLGWAETGLVYIFSNKPVHEINDFRGIKMWMWEGDNMVKEVFNTLDIVPTPLPVTDVLTSLQTKLIDGFYSPPVAALSLQWTTKVKYMLTQKMAYATGAILITKKSFDELEPSEKKILRETAKVYSKKLIDSIRIDNEKAKTSIKSSGISFTDATPASVAKMKTLSGKVAEELVGKLYSKDLLQKVRNLRDKAK